MSADERLGELESRYTLLEQTVSELNDVVTRQWQQLDTSKLRIERLEAALETLEHTKPVDSRPSHY